MTQLRHVPRVREYMSRYGLTAMVETGTEHGEGVHIGLKIGAARVVSCEILESNVARSRERFANDPRVTIYHGRSVDLLPAMLSDVKSHRALFWLDAHLPQCHDPNGRYVTEEDIIPLRGELETIRRLRDCSGDVILIDDLCFFDPSLTPDLDRDRWIPVPVTITRRDIDAMFPDHEATVLETAEWVLALTPR